MSNKSDDLLYTALSGMTTYLDFLIGCGVRSASSVIGNYSVRITIKEVNSDGQEQLPLE